MAQEVLVTLNDDLDGSDADVTIMFGPEGANYEIDRRTPSDQQPQQRPP